MTGAKRSQFLPDVPTAKESGYNVVVESWLGVFLPAKAPERCVARAQRSHEGRLAIRGHEREPRQIRQRGHFQTPEQFTETIKDDLKRWGPVVKASGFVAVD